jgi:hypothetical protein
VSVEPWVCFRLGSLDAGSPRHRALGAFSGARLPGLGWRLATGLVRGRPVGPRGSPRVGRSPRNDGRAYRHMSGLVGPRAHPPPAACGGADPSVDLSGIFADSLVCDVVKVSKSREIALETYPTTVDTLYLGGTSGCGAAASSGAAIASPADFSPVGRNCVNARARSLTV